MNEPVTERNLDVLENEIAELAAHIHAATYRLLCCIREFDQLGGWDSGFRSCAHWLNWRIGLDLGAAREKVRVARALEDLPAISEALRRGEVSYSKVRAITRIATPATTHPRAGGEVVGDRTNRDCFARRKAGACIPQGGAHR